MKVSRRQLRQVVIALSHGIRNLNHDGTNAMDEVHEELCDTRQRFDKLLEEAEGAVEFNFDAVGGVNLKAGDEPELPSPSQELN